MNMMRMMQGMGMGGMGGMIGMDEKSMLVDRVKKVQRQEGGKEKWENFVIEKGGGKKDPNLKNIMELKEFLMSADPHGASAMGTSLDSEVLKLAQQVRSGQKASDEFKEAWWKYCETEKANVR